MTSTGGGGNVKGIGGEGGDGDITTDPGGTEGDPISPVNTWGESTFPTFWLAMKVTVSEINLIALASPKVNRTVSPSTFA